VKRVRESVRWALTIIGLIGVTASVPVHVSACKRLPEEVHRVAGSFEVCVERVGGGATPTVKVSVERFNVAGNQYVAVAEAATDRAGIASFPNLPSGRYHVGTQQALGDSPGLEILVTRETGKPREERLTLQWPSRRVARLKRLEGTLLSFADAGEPPAALEGISVTLLEGYSGKEVETHFTDQDGDFAFSIKSPGLYFLRLRESIHGTMRPWGREDIYGDIPIELDPTESAAADHATYQVTMGDCGFMVTVPKESQ
jgi:hypothetical protein